MSFKKKLTVTILAMTLAVVAGSWLQMPCSGWRDCYLFLHRIKSSQSSADQQRQVLLDHFAASSHKIAFATPLHDGHSVGLVIAERTGKVRVISETGAHLGQPHFSSDGQRFILVRSRYDRPYRDLLSCQIATWRCEVVLRTADSIMFPVEIDRAAILYSASPVWTTPDGRKVYSTYDLYLARRGANPVRLTELKLAEFGWLSVRGDKIVFGADGIHNNTVLPKAQLDRTDIYSLDFDRRTLTIAPPALPLAPLFIMDTLSIRPAISADGQHIAFLKVERVRAKYRYDMAVATPDGVIERKIILDGLAFSHGAFVGETLLFNELFKDRYRVRQLDLAQGTVHDVLTLENSTQAIDKLERIQLQIDDGERSASLARSVDGIRPRQRPSMPMTVSQLTKACGGPALMTPVSCK